MKLASAYLCFSMDSIFLLSEGDRTAFLQHMMQSFGCTYICLWSFLSQPSKCLIFFDGVYGEQNNQPSSSSGSSLDRRLFEAYCKSVHYIYNNGEVPGYAFKNNVPYMELNLQELHSQRLASNEVQLQFYGAAGIKTVVLMGCATGEIELGFSRDMQMDTRMEMQNWFPHDFARQVASSREVPQTTDQNRASSSSSSLRSLSADSSEYPPLLFNIAVSTSFPPPDAPKEQLVVEDAKALGLSVPTSISTSPLHEAIPALNQMRNIQFPAIESEDTAMTEAILAVLSSPAANSSSCPYMMSQSMPPIPPISRNPSAFSSYRQGLSSTLTPVGTRTNRRQNNLLRRALLFFRNLDIIRRQQEHVQVGNRPTSTQIHHVISERRRREKLNESFQVLRSFLPPGSKKDKASVLNTTVESMSSLKKQVEELSKKNQILEAKLLAQRSSSEASSTRDEYRLGDSSSTIVQIVRVSTSTSETKMSDVNVTTSGEHSLPDLVTRILEFLKLRNDVTLISVEAHTRPIAESTNSVHGIMFRLRFEGDDFDESSFQEALKSVVDYVVR